jgi:hypothetical protein
MVERRLVEELKSVEVPQIGILLTHRYTYASLAGAYPANNLKGADRKLYDVLEAAGFALELRQVLYHTSLTDEFWDGEDAPGDHEDTVYSFSIDDYRALSNGRRPTTTPENIPFIRCSRTGFGRIMEFKESEGLGLWLSYDYIAKYAPFTGNEAGEVCRESADFFAVAIIAHWTATTPKLGTHLDG